VPAIVTPELFAEAQRRLAENSRFAPRNQKRHEYLLKGLVRCGRCGAAMSGAVSHGRRIYRCTAFDPYNVGERKVCRPAPWTDADFLEALVWDAVCNLLRHPETLRREFERRLQEAGAADALDLQEQELRRQLDGLRRQQDRLLDIYQAEEVDRDEVRRRLGELKRQKEQVERELTELKARREERERLRDVRAAFEEFLEDISAGLDALDFSGRQQLLRLLVHGVIVDADGGAVRIQTILPTPPKANNGRGDRSTSPSPAQLRCMCGDTGVQDSPPLRPRDINRDGARRELPGGNGQLPGPESSPGGQVTDPLLACPLRGCLLSVSASQPPHHETHHGCIHKPLAHQRQTLVILGQTTIPIDPGKGPFYNPTMGQNAETLPFASNLLNNLYPPPIHLARPFLQLPCIAPVRPYHPQPCAPCS